MSAVQSAASGQAAVPRRASAMWVQGLACGALITFATPTALLLGVLFAPAIIYALASPGCARNVLRAIASGCAAAALGPLWHMWMNGGRTGELLVILYDPATLCLAWGSGATAWALCEVLPVILRAAWDAHEAKKSAAIRAELDELTHEWGLTASNAQQSARPKPG